MKDLIFLAIVIVCIGGCVGESYISLLSKQATIKKEIEIAKQETQRTKNLMNNISKEIQNNNY